MSAFKDLVKRRSSCRRYDPDKPVPPELINQCLEAARLAPSACNKQPWVFGVVDQRPLLDKLWEKARLPGIKHLWLKDAAVIIVLCVRLDMITHRLAPALSGIPYYLIDAGIAGEHLTLAASEVGLETCWIGWFKARMVRKILGLPRSLKPVSLIAMGYPAAGWTPPEKKRLAMEEISFHNRWHS